jgi:hypothetical protein
VAKLIYSTISQLDGYVGVTKSPHLSETWLALTVCRVRKCALA